MTDHEIRIEQAKADKREKVQDAIAVIFREINCFGGEKEVGDAIKEAVMKQHNTLQQSFFGDALVPLIKAYAENKYTDLRNEASTKAAQQLVPILEEAYFPMI